MTADTARWFTARTRRVLAHKLNGNHAACNKRITPDVCPLVRDNNEYGVTLYTAAGVDSIDYMTKCPKCLGKPDSTTITLFVPFETWK